MLRSIACLCVAAGLFGTTILPVRAQQVNWVYANGYAKDHPQVGVLADEFIKRVETATDGRLNIRHVPGAALLKPENMVDGVRGGVANMGSTVVSFFPGQLPISATLAGLVDLNYGNRLDLNGITTITSQMLDSVPEFAAEYEKLGLKVIWFVPSPAYAVLSNDAIASLDGFAGKKIRVLGNVMPKLVAAAGAVPLSVAFSEIYTSLQTGVIDGALTDPPAMLNAKLFEVSKNLVTTGPGNGALTAIAPVAYFVNLNDWNALPKDLQDAVLSVAKEMTAVGSQKMTELADSSIGKLHDEGVEVHHLSAEDTEKLAAQAPDFLALAASELGKNGLPGDKIIAEYRRLADAYLAGK